MGFTIEGSRSVIVQLREKSSDTQIVLLEIILEHMMTKFKARFNMRHRLMVAFVLISLVPLLLHTAFNSRNARAILTADANQSLLTAATETANSLDSFLMNNLEALRAEAQFPVLLQYISLPVEKRNDSDEELTILAFLNTLSRRNPFITSYMLLDATGKVLLDTVTEDIGEDKTDWRYFSYFVENPNLRTYISPVQFAPETDMPFLYFSSPVVNRNGQMMGVLVASYRADVLQDLLQEKNGIVGAGSFAVLFDEHHLHLAHGTAPEVNYLPITHLPDDEVALLRTERRLPNLPDDKLFALQLDNLEANLSAMRKQPFFEAQDVATNDDLNQVAVIELKTRPWAVAFFQPQEVFLASIEAQNRSTLVLSGLLGVVAIITAVGMGNFIAKPIQLLTRTVTYFTKGEMHVRTNIQSTDEIGVLGKSFNIMAEQVGILVHGLEERTFELEKEIANRKQAEIALRESEARYRSTATLTA